MDDLIQLGNAIKAKRKSKKISLNRMSKDLYGSRGQVNYLSNIEQGKINVTYRTYLLINRYLKI